MRYRVLVCGIFLLAFVGTSQAEDYIANVAWNAFDGSSREYTGYGNSKGHAFENARSVCVSSFQFDEHKAFCYNAPVRADYQRVEQCESKWTSCIGWGHAVGDPCDSPCYKGQEETNNVRLGCTEYKFQCFKKVPESGSYLQAEPRK